MRIECPQYGHENGRAAIHGNWNYKISSNISLMSLAGYWHFNCLQLVSQ